MTKAERRKPETSGEPADLGAAEKTSAELEKEPEVSVPAEGDEGEGDPAGAPGPEERGATAAAALAKAGAELDRELEKQARELEDRPLGETAAPRSRKQKPTTACPGKPSFDWRVEGGKLVPNLREGEAVATTKVREGLTVVETTQTRFIYLCSIAAYEKAFAPLWPRLVWEEHFPQATSEPVLTE